MKLEYVYFVITVENKRISMIIISEGDNFEHFKTEVGL